MKLGAYDYITKPFKVDEIKLIIQKALEKRDLRKENILLKREIASRAGFENFIGKSAAMQKVFALIRQVADTKSTVLISGESGTGKELVARAVHFSSARKDKPFVTVNCGALPETLLESELFGYMKGSFTGATSNKQGLFEAANGGTIFLDEISATTLNLQIKLLRVIQERTFMRVGGTTDIKVDVRVIAASNKDLQSEVAKGAFREDLYYRLNVIPVHLPPLRERKEDIAVLVEHFLNKFTPAGKDPKKISNEALNFFTNYRWPGNVRELENTIERLVILASGDTIRVEHVPDSLKKSIPCPELIPSEIPETGLNMEELLENAERTLLRKALEKSGGVKTEAARLLGLSFRSFRHRLQKYESS
jgi:two-component system response regulator PilR (NtrC family)